jgi:tetratricopeptide (TPR) repeat protein
MDNREFYPAGYEQERKVFLSQMEACFDRNEPRSALDMARARLRRIPGDLDARLGICRAWLQQERIDETRDMLQEMEEIIASLSRIYACMGDVYMKKGMEDSAETFYRKCMALNPGTTRVRDILERLKGIEEPRGTDAEGETVEDAGIPPDFRTTTLAELYIRQGHLRPAEELLEKIVGQEPQNEKAAGLLQEVRGRILGSASEERYAGVIAELSRWLDNIGRVRGHAA